MEVLETFTKEFENEVRKEINDEDKD